MDDATSQLGNNSTEISNLVSGKNGVRFYTPNANLAQARANFYETYSVYVTKVEEIKN